MLELGIRLWSQLGSPFLLGYQPVDCANPHLGESQTLILSAEGRKSTLHCGLVVLPATGGDPTYTPPPMEISELTECQTLIAMGPEFQSRTNNVHIRPNPHRTWDATRNATQRKWNLLM